jgi:hypothetical protein
MAVKKKRKKKVAPKKKTTKKRVIKKRVAKKKVLKKVLKKKPTVKAKKPGIKKPKENIIGLVTHYFPKVRAAVIKLKKPLTTGDVVKIKGHTTDFKQTVTSMQIDLVPIGQAKKGQEIGLLVDSRVRQHDIVYKV